MADSPDNQRRTLLKAGVAGCLAGSGFSLVQLAVAETDAERASALRRWGMLIDTEKCAAGCRACVDACNDEHNLTDSGEASAEPAWIRQVTLSNPDGGVTSLPLMCQHCNDPPCVEVCPTGASFQRDDGVVLVNRHTCIGCRYCVIACPYQARSFVYETLTNQLPRAPRGKGTAESCTFCVHRIDQGGTPACVEACNSDAGGAMTFGDLNDPQSDIAAMMNQDDGEGIREDLGLDTAVRYRNL